MKRAISIFLTLLLLFSIQITPPPAKAEITSSGQCGDNVWWEYDSETDTTRVFGTGPMWNNFVPDWDLIIGPVSITVGKHVIVEEGVTTIGALAFRKQGFFAVLPPHNMQTVSLPDSLESIGMHAFVGCVELREVILPETVHTIGIGAFCNTGLTSVFIPQNVTTIG